MKKRILVIGGAVALVVLLAGAAFVGGQLLNGKGLGGLALGGFGGQGGPGLTIGGPGGKSVKLDIQPAKELPQTAADVRGLFDHRQDNSVFVGTGKVQMMVKKDQNGQMETSSSHDGPTVEVVVTTQTVIYRDVTMDQFDGPPPDGQKIQQVVEPGTQAEIGQNSMITVWGRKTGDRVIATVLVYSLPAFKAKP